jgi:AGZA family xanthine/uracil permease-like MFS transporter
MKSVKDAIERIGGEFVVVTPLIDHERLVGVLAAVGGGLSGASSVTTYVESASGVAQGGRTGLAAVVVGLLFLMALFFVPLGYLVPTAAAAPALIIVGYLMLTSVKDIPWDKIEDALPAFLFILLCADIYTLANIIRQIILATVSDSANASRR